MFEQDKSSQQQIKEKNLKLVFRLIHQHGLISRADIKKITGLSATTVSSLAEELINEGFVEEQGIKDTTTSGRKAVLLSVRPGGGNFASLEVKENVVIVDGYSLTFEQVFHAEVPIYSETTLVSDVASAVTAAGGNKLLGIVIASSLVDYSAEFRPNPDNEAMVHIAQVYHGLKNMFPNVYISLQHDAGLKACAELSVHSKTDCLVLINVHKEISAGIILNGQLYSGGSGTNGRIGHISVNPEGDACWCGNKGCLELYTSVPQILEHAGCESIAALKKKLEVGDKVAAAAVDTAAKSLAIAVNNVVNTISPHTVIISGEIVELGGFFIDLTKKYFREFALRRGVNKQIEYSELGETAVGLGGAKVAFDQYFGE